MTTATIHYYYDLTDDKQYSSDQEGNLVQLCQRCREAAGSDVTKAQNGDEESICELCDVEQGQPFKAAPALVQRTVQGLDVTGTVINGAFLPIATTESLDCPELIAIAERKAAEALTASHETAHRHEYEIVHIPSDSEYELRIDGCFDSCHRSYAAAEQRRNEHRLMAASEAADAAAERDEIAAELASEGLRRASADEAGWYALTSAGRVWATDEPAPTCHTCGRELLGGDVQRGECALCLGARVKARWAAEVLGCRDGHVCQPVEVAARDDDDRPEALSAEARNVSMLGF